MGSFRAELQRVLPCGDSPVRLSATNRRDGFEGSRARAPEARAFTYRDPFDGHIEIAKPLRTGYAQTATHACVQTRGQVPTD